MGKLFERAGRREAAIAAYEQSLASRHTRDAQQQLETVFSPTFPSQP